MSKKGAGYRLRKELLAINKDRPEFIWATHKETNILLWSFLVAPPDDTVYGSGWYWGRVTFPQDYPFAPPGIQFVTPSCRFRPETKICMSMSDYHPESWNPAWRDLGVLRRLHAIDATRVHLTMTWVVSFSISRPFGRAGGRRGPLGGPGHAGCGGPDGLGRSRGYFIDPDVQCRSRCLARILGRRGTSCVGKITTSKVLRPAQQRLGRRGPGR